MRTAAHAHRNRPFLAILRLLFQALLVALVGWGVVVGLVLVGTE